MTASKISRLQHFDRDGQVEDLARFVWPGEGPVQIEAVAPDGLFGAAELVKDGIHTRDHRVLTLADGEAFIDELPFAISGDHLWATRVELLPQN